MAFLSHEDAASVAGLEHVDDVRVEGPVGVDETRIATAGSNSTCVDWC